MPGRTLRCVTVVEHRVPGIAARRCMVRAVAKARRHVLLCGTQLPVVIPVVRIPGLYRLTALRVDDVDDVRSRGRWKIRRPYEFSCDRCGGATSVDDRGSEEQPVAC